MATTTKTIRIAIATLPFCLAFLPAHSQDLSATLGKKLAASSRLEWVTKEAGHPVLGNIRFAFLKNAVETRVGNAKIYSRAYLSCQKGLGKFAIELTNATAPDDPSGLRAATEPRLYCNRPIQPWDEKLVEEALLANWEYNKIGDALTQGFRPFPLRECVSIRVVQEVALPAGWAQKSAHVEFEILPYNRELDSIFVTCGEDSAYAADAPAAPAAASAPATAFAPIKPATPSAPPKLAMPTAAPRLSAPSPPVQAAGVAWQTARVISTGKTNVRAGPTLDSAIVVQLDPGAVVLVQRTGNEWWRAKPSSGAAFDGYIRQDRLVFK